MIRADSGGRYNLYSRSFEERRITPGSGTGHQGVCVTDRIAVDLSGGYRYHLRSRNPPFCERYLFIYDYFHILIV